MTHAEFHSLLLENLSTAILVLDAEHRVCFISPAAQALLELSETRSMESRLDELLPEHAQLLLGLDNDIESAYTNRSVELRLANGHELTVDCTVTPLPPSGLLILELHQVDRIMRINREEVLISSQENNQALIRGLAHEIKNPLGGLRGAAQLLAKQLPDPDLQEYTRIIIEESDRLRDLVDRLLGPQRQPHYVQLNIHEVLEHVRALVQAEVGTAVTVCRDYDPSVPDLTADRSQLIQATLNIVRNALQATNDNAGERVLTLRTRIQRHFTIGARLYRLVCRVDIADNGAGIPAQLKDSLFIPMVSGRPGGTGLGLSIAQSIINQHQGLIECRSEPGNTLFTLYLPLEVEHA